MPKDARKLAVVTGASSGIGYELARCCARNGFDLVIAADEKEIEDAAKDFQSDGALVETVQADLATREGVERLANTVSGRQVDALIANAGHGTSKGFLDVDFERSRHVINTNVTGTLELIYRIGRQMRDARRGRILITGSIAGYTPAPFQAVYNASKAFIDSFSYSLREELSDSGVTVTCLMPGATATDFFDRAGMQDTKIGQSKKDDPKMVAEQGFEAMMKGDDAVVTGWMNKLMVAASNVTPSTVLAKQARKQFEPGSANK